MFNAKRLFITAAVAILLFVSAVSAQAQDPASGVRSNTTVTAAATADRVRFTAPGMVVQMRLEVYNANGERLFDNEIRGGNVIDWLLQDGRAQRLSDGSYLCVITTKSLSGRWGQKSGRLTIENTVATMHPIDATQLTAQQIQAVGPLEENASLTLVKQDENQTATVIAHDGTDGQIIRGKGALSFRIGDFVTGKDAEQMRLTPEGNLGIGITNPAVKLDVDGLIHASQGIVFPDGSVQYSASRKTFGPESLRPGQSLKKPGQGKVFETASPDTSGTRTSSISVRTSTKLVPIRYVYPSSITMTERLRQMACLWSLCTETISPRLAGDSKPLLPPRIVCRQGCYALQHSRAQLGEGLPTSKKLVTLCRYCYWTSLLGPRPPSYLYKYTGDGPTNRRYTSGALSTNASTPPTNENGRASQDPNVIKVIIIEDQRDVREGRAVLINGSPGFRCLAAFRTMEDALRSIGGLLPDVVLTDIGLPGMSGVDGTRILKESLKEVALGGAPMSPEVARRVIKLFREFRPPERASHRLTPQETELLKLIIEGHGYKTAAARLDISVSRFLFTSRTYTTSFRFTPKLRLSQRHFRISSCEEVALDDSS